MGFPRKALLSVLAITHVLSLVPPFSTPPSSRTAGLHRGRTATSNHSRRGSGNSRVFRCRHRSRQHILAGEGGMIAAGESLSMASGERKAALGGGSISSRQRRRGERRRCHDATAASTADGDGTSSTSSTSSSSTTKGGAASQGASAPPRDSGGILSSLPNGAPAADAGPVNGGRTFRELFHGRLPDWLLARLEQLGFATPTLVQRQALEVILGEEKNDAVLHAQTGSGKTLAFLLPLFARVDPSRAAVQGLVVVPTRELGLQVAGVAKRLAAGTSSGRDSKIQQVMSVLEGSSNKRQRAWAWADPPHIVIGNPESLTRLVTTGAVRVNAVSYVVVDEVDACLLSEGTRASLHELLARSLSPTHADEDEGEDEEETARLAEVGAGRVTGAAAPVNRKLRDRQTVFASATVPQHNHFIRQCVQKQWTLTEPVHVQVHAKEAMPPCLSHYYVVCPPEKKLAVLRALVKRELGVSASAEAAARPAAGASSSAAAAAAGAAAVAPTAGEGDGPSGGQASGDGVSDTGIQADNTRGLVFALATKPLEGIAASLDKALGGRGSGGGGEGGGREQQQAKGRGEQQPPPPPPLAEFLREELGLNARADAMSLFREGKTRLLVSTDMAARGLDVPEV
ncbi:unnamed protein product, partial [Ectocarpus fasciculatus]